MPIYDKSMNTTCNISVYQGKVNSLNILSPTTFRESFAAMFVPKIKDHFLHKSANI